MDHTEQERDDDLVIQDLRDLGVTVELPISAKEVSFANTLDALAQFVLYETVDQTIRLLSEANDASVGELSGGNVEQSIYRISFHDEDSNKKGAAELLVDSYNEKNRQRQFSISKLKQYMLQMCNKRNDGRVYERVGNLMFILSFGLVHGQVRHIDHMNPNLQICLYMSRECPSTIIYDMTGIPINSCSDLLRYWSSISHDEPVPKAIEHILLTMGDLRLDKTPYAKYFASSWFSFNHHLRNFGRLYQPISRPLQLKSCDPGTTLIAGGANHVHAGPPASGPRMFAFATGIPENDDDHVSETVESLEDGDENDGEVQYSPSLLHIDFSCIVFGMLDFEEPSVGVELEIYTAKQFLLDRLLALLKEYPKETYEQQLGEERQSLKEWLKRVVPALASPREIQTLLQEAISSDTLMYSPDVQTKSFRKFKQRHLKKSRQKTR